MPRSTVRVYKSDGVWVVKRDGNSKSSGNFYTQKEAYLKARDIALRNGLTITVYYPTGGIQKVISPKEKGRSSDEEGCFITTACVRYFGLRDDCYELETLRNYRDTYMSSSPRNKSLVDQYYKIAPKLVVKLENDQNKKEHFDKIFKKVKEACLAIENKKYVKAKRIYISVISGLLNHLK
ncbi:MAG: DUF2188 domain-containing protein [Bacteroidia bacterium]